MLRITFAGSFAACALGLAAAASAQTLPTQAYPFKSGPVTITSCSVGQSGNTVAGTSLEVKYFQNVPRRHLISVSFRVRYAGQEVNFTDSGKFSFGAVIDHKFNELAGAPWAGPDPQVCRVTSATFGDGQTVAPQYLGPNGTEQSGDAGQMGAPGAPGAPPPPAGSPPPYAVPEPAPTH